MRVKLIKVYGEKDSDRYYDEFRETIRTSISPATDWLEVSEEDFQLLRCNLHKLPTNFNNEQYLLLEEIDTKATFNSIEEIKEILKKEEKLREKAQRKQEEIARKRKETKEKNAKLKAKAELEKLAKELGVKIS